VTSNAVKWHNKQLSSGKLIFVLSCNLIISVLTPVFLSWTNLRMIQGHTSKLPQQVYCSILTAYNCNFTGRNIQGIRVVQNCTLLKGVFKPCLCNPLLHLIGMDDCLLSKLKPISAYMESLQTGQYPMKLKVNSISMEGYAIALGGYVNDIKPSSCGVNKELFALNIECEYKEGGYA
jgi:hypothetical protein